VIAKEVEPSKVGAITLEHKPDLAIVALHDDTHHALDLITEIVDEATCPVAVLADDASREFVAQAAERGIFAYLDSTDETELMGGIDVALQRYNEYRKLLAAFERRARIERAKGIVMARDSVNDREAFDRIRQQARSSRRKLIEVVDELVASEAS
jgi:AmiR/NasT family two-component response regulator